MSRKIETEVFKFNELSDAAKENARNGWRECADGCSPEYVIEDAETIANLMGIEFDQRYFKTMGGGSGHAPKVYFSGFNSQGDGACFSGSYSYKPGALKAVKGYAPKDAEIARIAKALQNIQKPYFYKLRANCEQSGHYMHSGCMRVDVMHTDDEYRDVSKAEDDMRQALRDFADWIYSRLEREYDYQNEDSTIDENILANEYEFTAEGNIV